MNKVEKPWGYYEVLYEDKCSTVKRLVIHPGQRISLQSHNHRSEHWVVVEGVAWVELNADTITLLQDEYVYIPLYQTHRVTNDDDIPLVIIEVQYGDCREDDIVRYADDYNRIP